MNFFRCFTVKKTDLALPAESLASLYLKWVAYKYAICKECLWIKYLFAPKCLVYRGKNKGFENRLEVNFVRKKWISHENNLPAFH